MATQNVSQVFPSHNSLVPRHGVITLCGYGIQVRVHRGHLLIQDGVGSDRRQFRLSRVGHGLQRLIVIGNDGVISLAALRWLVDQNAAFTLLERNGKVLCVTGPVRPSDARLRRAQALAHHSGAALRIALELISRKLAGQERVARNKLNDSAAAQEIAASRLALAEAETIEAVRYLESKGAVSYWAAWRALSITFPTKDVPGVPAHWLRFESRKSLLSGSQRLATNPVNAMLNYLYALLESESRLAVAALGLDPGLGFIHVDTTARDSLACDVLEAVRPNVDDYVLDWILSQPLRREWFFEQRDGNCRLMATFARRLSETTQMWASAIAPIAEWVARQLWLETRKRSHSELPPTRLTQTNKRQARDISSELVMPRKSRLENLCRGCGKTIRDGGTQCATCAIPNATEHLVSGARLGRIAAQSQEARAKHAESERRHAQARASWDPATQPAWLTENLFSQKIQPLLASVSSSAIRSTIGVSHWYASKIRQGYRPHPRHWQVLAELVGLLR